MFLLTLIGLAMGCFLGVMYFTCDALIAGICAVGAAIFVFILIPRCLDELEKWGRFRSNLVVWSTFLIGFGMAVVMVGSTVVAYQINRDWTSLESEYIDFVNQGVKLSEGYDELKRSYLGKVEQRLDLILSKSKVGRTPSYADECPYLLGDYITSQVISTRFVGIESAINQKDMSILTDVGDQGQMIRNNLSTLDPLRRCQLKPDIQAFRLLVLRLEGVFLSSISNDACDVDLLSRDHGGWLLEMESFSDRSIDDADVTVIDALKDAGLVGGIGGILALIFVLSPILFARTTEDSSANGEKLTEI